jgi:glycosyltransferase involved in cell wall biosynthesis
MLKIDYINGRSTLDLFGTSKYNNEINKRLTDVTLNNIEYPQVGKSRIVDGILKRTLYPVIVRNEIRQDVIKHVTNQDLAFLLTCIKIHPVIVTCYDLIPVAYYHNNSWYWKLNLKGLRKADHIITISEFSKDEILRFVNYPEEQITVIYPGVDHSAYHQNKNRAILDHYKIPPENKVILFVGSEEPRKNISLLIKALYYLKKTLPNVTLLKVGGTQMGGDRQALLNLISRLGLADSIKFTGQVPEADIPVFYNAADLFVFPSGYEGFGLPPLEAMACGCPVICSFNTSIPEVAGDAAVMCNPSDEQDLAKKMLTVLSDEDLREQLVSRGFSRSRNFSWDTAASCTSRLYHKMEKHVS